MGVQYTAYILLFIGKALFERIGRTPPAFLTDGLGSRVIYFVTLTLWATLMQNMITATGAFELYLNNNLLFSKLEKDRMPHINEVFHSLKSFSI